MNAQPNFDQMAQKAREARERAELERQNALTAELELVAGEAYYEFSDLFDNTALTHDAKVGRYRAAITVLRGEGGVSAAAAAASSAPFDYASLPEEARQIIDMVVADPSRFKVEEWGAVKDKSYTRLRKDFEARAQASGADDSSSSAQPAPVKKAAPPKKAAAPTPDKESKADEPDAGTPAAAKPEGQADDPKLAQKARAKGKGMLDKLFPPGQ